MPKILGELPDGTVLAKAETPEDFARVGKTVGLVTTGVTLPDGKEGKIVVGTVREYKDEIGRDAPAEQSASETVRGTQTGYSRAYSARFDEIFRKDGGDSAKN